ncbi:MAG: hypothetical protein HPY55_11540 [Firmicutes bacterium]|nr:hypothetical protein [Bacillota bacterium]
MSIKPLDLQASVPKSGEVGRVVKIQQEEGQARLSDVASSFRALAEKAQRQVRTPPKATGGRIERDRRNGRRWREDRDQAGEAELADSAGSAAEAAPGPARDPRKGELLDLLL